jgi:hypothetical protein
MGPCSFQKANESNPYLVRFQVLTAASMKFRIVFWDVLPCKIIVDRRFRGTCWIHHHDEGSPNSETSVDNYFTRQYIPEDNSELQTHILFHKTGALRTVSDVLLWESEFFIKFHVSVEFQSNVPAPSTEAALQREINITSYGARTQRLCYDPEDDWQTQKGDGNAKPQPIRRNVTASPSLVNAIWPLNRNGTNNTATPRELC